MNIKRLTIAALLAGAVVAPAQAGNFLFQYDADQDVSQVGSPLSATLYLTTSNVLNSIGGYDILSATGTIDGVAVLGLKPDPFQPDAYGDGYYIYDNTIYLSGPFLDGPGLVVTTATMEFNFGYDGSDTGGYYAISTDYSTHLNSHGVLIPVYETSEGAASLSPAPEPVSWAMMVVGFGMAGAAMRRRRTAVSFG